MGSQLVASINNGVITYAHQDHLGGTNVITNAAGTKTEVTEYKPFGEIKRRDRYGSSQEVAWYYFTGKKLDDETGLYYYGARYYNPIIGRFLTPDTIVQAPLNPQTLNRYSYCGNNPVNRIDPSGHSWKSFWKKFGDFISPLGRAIVTGDWKNFGYQVLNIATIAIGVVTANPWMVASGALSYASRATSHIGGNVANEISNVLGYAAIATAVIGTGVQIHSAWQSAHAASTGSQAADVLQGFSTDPFYKSGDLTRAFNSMQAEVFEKVSAAGDLMKWANNTNNLLLDMQGLASSWSPFDFLGGGGFGAGKGLATAAGRIGSARTIVIGETAGRVANVAQRTGAEFFTTSGKLTTEQLWNANESWLISKLNVGYRVVDIGLDSARASRGIFYQMEQQTIAEWSSTTGKSVMYAK